MNLQVKPLTSGLVKIVSELVGNSLSKFKGEGNTLVPSVFQARQKPPKPDLPYALCDRIGIYPLGYSDRAAYLDSNLDEVTEFDYRVRLSLAVYGGTKDDSLSIAEDFRSRLLTTLGREASHTHWSPLNADLLAVSPVSFFPSLLSTDFQEVSRITIDLWARSIITDPTTGTIESISLEGSLYKDYEQIEPPLEVNVNVP